jgi:hypothetical protein
MAKFAYAAPRRTPAGSQHACAKAFVPGMIELTKKGEPPMSEREYLDKAEALRRLSEPGGDHELHAALERMRLDHPHLWGVLHRLHLAHDADPKKLEEWRRAPKGSREDALSAHYDEAIRVLQMSLQ